MFLLWSTGNEIDMKLSEHFFVFFLWSTWKETDMKLSMQFWHSFSFDICYSYLSTVLVLCLLLDETETQPYILLFCFV